MNKKHKSMVIGLVLCVLCAAIGWQINKIVPLIGSSVAAMFIGMAIASLFNKKIDYSVGAKFASKKLLRLAIIGLGFSINFSLLTSIGAQSLIVMSFTLISAYLFVWPAGKLLGINFNQRNLIATGTGICGGSAIAAVSPILKASDEDIAHAMAATFLFDVVAVFVFPILGECFNMSDLGYGIWAGTAVNDTSSVVAAGFAFSKEAGEIATIVKMTRTCALLPIAFLLLIAVNYRERKSNTNTTVEKVKFNPMKYIPGFLLVFIAVVCLNSLVVIPSGITKSIDVISHICIALALAGVGLGIDFKSLIKKGGASLTLGAIISVVVVVVSLAVQYEFGIL